jgi:RNase P/RNase MRP subunit p30
MPREFVDSIRPNSELHLSAYLHIANQLGFSEIWISNPSAEEKQIYSQDPFPSLVRVYPRLEIGLKHETKRDLTTILQQQRRNYPIISVTCFKPEVAAWAAQDNRVDILSFPIFQTAQLMTRSVAKLMIKFNKHFELALSELYTLPTRLQISALRHIQSALEIASQKKVPIIFNSGSRMPNQMRTPRDLAALGQLISFTLALSLDQLSLIPRNLIKRNLLKISPNYITPGVFKIPFGSNTRPEEEE